MNRRNEYEEKVFQLLLDCGIPSVDIAEPDKEDSTNKKEPDFLIEKGKLVIEVKHFEDRKLLDINESFQKKLNGHKTISFEYPDKNDAFKEHLRDSSRKFRSYPEYASLLVVDLVDYKYCCPSIESMIAGKLTMHIDLKTNNVTHWTQTDRSLRINDKTEVGAVCFLTLDGVKMFHNLLSNPVRRLPFYFWAKQLEKVKFNQYVYFGPPGGLSHIYELSEANIVN